MKCFNCGMEVRLLSSCHSSCHSHLVRAHVVQGHKFTACPFPKEHGGGRAATQAAAAAAAAAAKAARVTTSSADVLDGGMTMVFFPGLMINARMLVTFCRMSLTLCRSSCWSGDFSTHSCISAELFFLTLHTSHVTPHTSHLTRHTSHLTPHTSHLTPHTSHPTPHTSHLTTCRIRIGRRGMHDHAIALRCQSSDDSGTYSDLIACKDAEPR